MVTLVPARSRRAVVLAIQFFHSVEPLFGRVSAPDLLRNGGIGFVAKGGDDSLFLGNTAWAGSRHTSGASFFSAIRLREAPKSQGSSLLAGAEIQAEIAAFPQRLPKKFGTFRPRKVPCGA